MSSNHSVNEFYDGSDILTPFISLIGLPIDQVNFLACQFCALVIGYFYRVYLGPHKASPTVRHVIQILVGVPLTYFCFGRQIIHLVAQSIICFALMRFLEPGIMEVSVLIVAMAYLCVCHSYRMIYDYGGYTLDITGPLMLNTQRLSSLAFNLRDGRVKDPSCLTSQMKQLAVREFPSVIELVSYVFCFHGLMCGPFCFYKDYIAFVDGSNYSGNVAATATGNGTSSCRGSSSGRTLSTSNHLSSHARGDISVRDGRSGNNSHRRLAPPPAPGAALQQKMLTALFYGVMTILVLPKFPITVITGPEFRQRGFFGRMFYILLFAALQRQKYYFAWKLGESVNASAGLGFNGYDDRGIARWDLIDNADIVKVELSTSLKELLDNWNRSTAYWLRFVIYDRVHSTVPVFFFSAFWHGFYAGYYLTYFTGGILIHTARLMRRRVRPMFLSSQTLKFIYDSVTFTATRIAIAYLGFPFLVLEFRPVLEIYSYVYFWMHIAAVVSAAVLLMIPGQKRHSKKE